MSEKIENKILYLYSTVHVPQFPVNKIMNLVEAVNISWEIKCGDDNEVYCDGTIEPLSYIPL